MGSWVNYEDLDNNVFRFYNRWMSPRWFCVTNHLSHWFVNLCGTSRQCFIQATVSLSLQHPLLMLVHMYHITGRVLQWHYIVSFSMPQVCPGFLWETGFTWLSSGRFQRSRHELTQKRTAWRSSRSVRSATSTSSSPSQSFHASCWWGMGWRNSGGPIEVSWLLYFYLFIFF